MAQFAIPAEEVRKMQMRGLEMALYFDSFCQKHGLTYYMCGGCCIGSIRNGGFIPWDDDVDVTMRKSDYRKLKKVLLEQESADYCFQCMDTDPDYVNVFGKFRKKHDAVASTDRRSQYFKYQGIGIDVFFLEKSTRFAAHMAKFFYLNMQHPTQYIKNRTMRHLAIRIVQILNLGLLIPLCRLIGRLLNFKNEYRVSLGSGFYKSKFFLKDIFPLTKMEFEGIEFPVPGNTDAYLTNIYGDWRKLPTEEQIRKSMHYPVYIKEIFGEE